MSNIKIKVKTLGEFNISCAEAYFTSLDLSNQLCFLLSFLLIYPNASQELLIDALWPEEINNPTAALKNLVYRLRKILEKGNFPYAKDLILFVNGRYKINPALNIEVDVLQFEKIIKKDIEDLQKDFLNAYPKALNMYKGDFLSTLPYADWIMPLAQHYKSLYFDALYQLLNYYSQQGCYAEMLSIAHQGVVIDKFEENIHKYIILGFYKTQQSPKALAHYQYVTDLFYSGLGVELSSEMQKLYKEIVKSTKSEEVDIHYLTHELTETPSAIQDALYCEFEAFKQIYHFTARSSVRSGTTYFLGLITLVQNKKDKASLEIAMDKLNFSIRLSLRKGDVFTRPSPNQYAILLGMITYENSLMVMKRIEKNFKTQFKGKNIKFSYNVHGVDAPFWE